MSTRILLGSGVLALAAIGTVLFVASKPETPAPATHERASADSSQRLQHEALEVYAPDPSPSASPSQAPSPAPSAEAGLAQEGPFIIKRILPIKGPIKYGEWHWDEANVPDGPLVITVDLDARVLSVFRGGYEIGTTAVLLGTQDTPTPTGVFPITQKDIDHVSNIYTGAPMPYMQRLTNDGVSLHGSMVAKGYASHGCIGMPNPFAAKLFAMTKLGDKVYITRGKHVGLGASLAGS